MSQSQRRANSALPAPIAASALHILLPVVSGAIATILVLALLRFGASRIWGPFAISAGAILGSLALSALVGGAVAAILKGRARGPVEPFSVALGWALWGLALHFSAQGRYLELLPGGLLEEQWVPLIFANAVAQSVCVAAGLALASGVAWLINRRHEFGNEEVSDDEREGNGLQSFSAAFLVPLLTVVFGLILMLLLGAATHSLSAQTLPVEKIPGGPLDALWRGLLTMFALAVATWSARRLVKTLGGASDLFFAPLVIMFIAVLSTAPFATGAALLIWHTSGFEIASWAAIGAGLGYAFAHSQMSKS